MLTVEMVFRQIMYNYYLYGKCRFLRVTESLQQLSEGFIGTLLHGKIFVPNFSIFPVALIDI